MTLRIFFWLAVAGSFVLGGDLRAADESRASSAAELRTAVHTTLRETARSKDHRASAQRLLEVYRALDADKEIVREDRLKMQHVVRGRLEKLAGEIRKLPSRDADAAEANLASQGVNDFLDALVAQATRPAIANRPAVLAQRGNMNMPGAGPFPGQGAAFAPPGDYGQDLVELIEATISPGSWDTNGGLGTIRYFGPLRVLVVRQSSEVHEQLGDLLPQMRN